MKRNHKSSYNNIKKLNNTYKRVKNQTHRIESGFESSFLAARLPVKIPLTPTHTTYCQYAIKRRYETPTIKWLEYWLYLAANRCDSETGWMWSRALLENSKCTWLFLNKMSEDFHIIRLLKPNCWHLFHVIVSVTHSEVFWNQVKAQHPHWEQIVEGDFYKYSKK